MPNRIAMKTKFGDLMSVVAVGQLDPTERIAPSLPAFLGHGVSRPSAGSDALGEPTVVVAACDSRWARRRNLRLADLIGEPWVLAQPGSLARSLHNEVFRRNGLETPSAKVLTVSLHLHLRLIETGRWLGLIPASVMRFGGQRMHLKALPIKLISPPAPVGFVMVKDRMLTPLAERFIACARKIATSDTGRAFTRRL